MDNYIVNSAAEHFNLLTSVMYHFIYALNVDKLRHTSSANISSSKGIRFENSTNGSVRVNFLCRARGIFQPERKRDMRHEVQSPESRESRESVKQNFERAAWECGLQKVERNQQKTTSLRTSNKIAFELSVLCSSTPIE